MNGTARRNVASDYAAIVLCGPGGQMGPLSRSENLPKALLPIGNRAMIESPLLYLDDAGINTIFVLCLDSHEAAINTWIKTSYRGNTRPIVVAASDEDDLAGSADAVRFLLEQDRFRSRLNGSGSGSSEGNVIVVSCDARCDVPLHQVLDGHRASGAILTSVCFDPATGADPGVKKKDGGHLLGFVNETSDRPSFAPTHAASRASDTRLVVAGALADIDDEVSLRTSMLWRYGKVRLSSRLRQLHLYVVRRSVLDVIVQEPAISRFDADFVSTLCKAQYQSALRQRFDLPDHILCRAHFVGGGSGGGESNTPPVPRTTAKADKSTSTSAGAVEQHHCNRINTTRAYAEAQKHALRYSTQEPRIPASFKIAERSTIGSDCLVASVPMSSSTATTTRDTATGGGGGDGVSSLQASVNSTTSATASTAGTGDGSIATGLGGSLDEKSTVKRSILGLSVRIGKNCRITGCTLMDGVVVGDGVKLENCIVCTGATIGERCSLKECVVGARYRVQDRLDKKGEELFEGGEISLQ